MNKKEAIELFKSGSILFCECGNIKPRYSKNEVAYGWTLFIDTLHRERKITDKQVNEWKNPW